MSCKTLRARRSVFISFSSSLPPAWWWAPQWINQCLSILSFFYPEWYVWKNHFSYLNRKSGKILPSGTKGSKFSLLLKTTFLLGLGGCSYKELAFFFVLLNAFLLFTVEYYTMKSSLQNIDKAESVGARDCRLRGLCLQKYSYQIGITNIL